MEFRILGPLEVFDDGRAVQMPGGKPRTLLALLALRHGDVVSTDAIVDGLWGEHPPETAGKSIQIYVSRLRKVLGEDSIVTRSPGYVLAVDPSQLDLVRFEQCVEEARSLSPSEAGVVLRDALALWRGPALADIAANGFATAETARLEELRLSALEDRIDADLAAGLDGQVVGELESLVRQHPFRERVRGQLMVALYRTGRQVDALDVYRKTRSLYAEELGLEPGQEIRELERRILAQDPTLGRGEEHAEQLPIRPVRSRPSRRVVALATGAVAAVAVGVVAIALASRDTASPVVAPSDSVAVIDPGRDRVLDAIPLGSRPSQIAVHGDDVWVLLPDERRVSHVAGASRAVKGTVGVSGAPSDLAADLHGAWVSDSWTGGVTLVEPQRHTVTRTVKTRPRSVASRYTDAGQIAIGFGSVWVASGDRAISRIDERTGRVMARILDVETSESAGGIATGGGAVWVAGPTQQSPLTRIDPARNRVSARIVIEKWRSSGIAFGRGLVWMSDAGNNQVWRVDPLRNVAVGTTHVGLAPLGVAFAHGSVWVANAGDGTVSRIDPVTATVVETITVGGSPTGIAASGDEVWVTVA